MFIATWKVIAPSNVAGEKGIASALAVLNSV
jgi:hypothetical protein